MKKLAVITSTRAEFGLLAPVVRELRKFEGEGFKADLIVTGTHLSAEYGMTVDEIKRTDMRIDAEVPIPVDSSNSADTSRNQAAALTAFAALFQREYYDAILVLGDRYEMLAIVIAASNALIPVFHMCGGDVTEGAIDDSNRHVITKMSYLHFPTNAASTKRVIQLGESPDRVFCYGSTSMDNVLSMADMSKAEAMESVGLKNSNYALCTFHPVTLEGFGLEDQVHALICAMEAFPEIEFIVTKSNSDRGGSLVNALLDKADERIPNVHVFDSLGVRRYLSLMRHALFVLGNSSSGIVEAPMLKVPTVNIGDRQRGRLRSSTVIDCESNESAIVEAIRHARSPEMVSICERTISPYGTGDAGRRIAAKCVEALMSDADLKKGFYDIPFQLGGD